MKTKSNDNLKVPRHDSGFILLIVMVFLVILSALGYTLSTQVSSRIQRDQYKIDYQIARYGCDSGVKFALASLEDIKPELVSHPNVPDFSDLFQLSEEEYQELLSDWAAQKEAGLGNDGDSFSNSKRLGGFLGMLSGMADTNSNVFDTNSSINDTNSVSNMESNDEFDPNDLTIPGPYGAEWPLIKELKEIEIGTAKVTIEIEDENAKYPITWAMLEDEKNPELKRVAEASFETFCEWMNLDTIEIEEIKSDLAEINETKPFKFDPKPIKIVERAPAKTTSRSSRTRSRTTRRRTSRTSSRTKTIPATVHTADFAKLFHSSMLDTEILAKQAVVSEKRNESALRYLGMWGSRKVNINTAPRHVLEAAFMFGGDEVEIAEQVIMRRRNKPFKDIAELKKTFLRYTVQIQKCEKYITTQSNFFTIRVTATSGVAKASAIIAIIKEGEKVQRVAVLDG
ncbi:MAG: type II secretion system protein GspK [Planctomycetota bacterium]|jgi:hypothetical protein